MTLAEPTSPAPATLTDGTIPAITIEVPIPVAAEFHNLAGALLADPHTPTETRNIATAIQASVEIGYSSLIEALTRCERTTNLQTLTEPAVYISPDGGRTVIIPGRKDPMSLLNVALGVVANADPTFNAQDESINADITPGLWAVLGECDDPDHDFHPNIHVTPDTPGAMVISVVEFSAS